jgi:hypothetical protein
MVDPQQHSEAGRRGRYLLLDQRIVARVRNATLRVCQAEKDAGNPLFREDKPWEVRYDNLYPNVRRDPSSGLYQCWYSPFIVDDAVSSTPVADRSRTKYDPERREMGVCYAESRDGIAWTKPDLGLVEFEGAKSNNLVARGPHGAGVYFDPRETEAARRYKMFYVDCDGDGDISGAFSPDGKRWEEAVRFPEIEAEGDTHNNAIWVASLGKYVGITRTWDDRSGQRLVARTESPDFVSWTKAVEVMRADPRSPESQTYSMPIFEYGGVFLGLVAIFHVPTDTVQTELAWSPDTVRWERIDAGSPVIARGPAGAPDSGCAYAAAPVFEDDEIRLYYGGSNGPHTSWRDGFFCLARLRPDRFAAFQPSSAGAPGLVVTHPVKVTSDDLRINADARGGQVRAGLFEAGGSAGLLSLDQAVPIRADVLSGPCRWREGSLRALVGKEVQLAFELQAARVFSFEFA